MASQLGTWGTAGPVSQFWCHKCETPKATFRVRWYTGYHAGGDEDRPGYMCPDCGAVLEVEEVEDKPNG